MELVEIKKNGNGKIKYTWEIDIEQPQMRQEGYQYFFNFRLVKTETLAKERT